RDASRQCLFIRDLALRLKQLPGVEAAAAVSDLPATGASSATIKIKGVPDLPANRDRSALDFVVTPDYFRTAGIALVRGRTFAHSDGATAPRVILVNQEFVHRYLPDEEPLSKQIMVSVSGLAPEWSEIVGVVDNVKTYSESARVEPQVFEAFLQRPVASFSV